MNGIYCKHSELKLVRAHPESDVGKRYGNRAAWTDEHGVLNIIQCVKCGTYLPCRITECVFGQEPPSKLERALQAVEYWLGLEECVCHSKQPIGTCLKCDLENIKKVLENKK